MTNFIEWGNHRLDDSESTGHFLAVGASGSGKSTLLQKWMQSTISRVGVAPDTRALVYDAKQDALPILEAICPHAKIVTAHPYDRRGFAWDICRDVTDPAVALEIAFTLIPSVHESQPFFSDAARHLTYGCMLSFILTEKHWTLATLMRVMQSARRIRSLLRRHPETRLIAKEYFHDPRLAANIMTTIATKLLPLQNIAASWETASEMFSLEEWVRGDWILVLGNFETGRTAIEAVNRCLFKRATDLLLNQTNSFSRRTFIILDELTEMGKLDGLVPLMKKGRSKGASCCLAFQSVSGMRYEALYGHQQTDEILGQIANRFFGRLECVATAEWASSLFGDQEREEEHASESTGAGGTSRTVSKQIVNRRLVIPSEFMNVAACNRKNGLSGYYIVRSHGAYFDQLPAADLWDNSLIAPRRDVLEFDPRPPRAKLLALWSPEEEAAFCHRPRKRETAQNEQSVAQAPTVSEPRTFGDLDEHFQ